MSLNDSLLAWGARQSPAVTSADEAWNRLEAPYTQDQVAAFDGANNFNLGLERLADGGEILKSATLWLDSRYSQVGEPRAINQGSGGSALNATYGSLLGGYIYQGAAVLPGVAGNYLSVPDAAALDITGDIEVVVRVSLVDWTPTSGASLVAKRTVADLLSYQVGVSTAGQLVGSWRVGGVDYFTNAFADFTGVAVDGSTYWIRMRRIASTGVVSFHYAPDSATEPSVWTALTTGGTQNAGNIDANAAIVEIGSNRTGTSDALNGSIYRSIVRNGIAGTTVLDVDLANVPNYATSFTAVTGQTVTVNSTSVDTNDPLFLPHTGENYAYLLNAATAPSTGLTPSGDVEVLARLKQPNASSGGNKFMSFGSLDLNWFQDGTVYVSIDVGGGLLTNNGLLSSLATTPGQTYWLRFRRTASTGAISLDVAPDSPSIPTVWTRSASASGTRTAGNLAAASALSLQGGDLTLYRTILRHSFDGANVLDVDIPGNVTSSAATSFTATTGQTVTVSRATTGRKTALVTRPVWLFGTDDYLEILDAATGGLLDFGASEDFTVLAVARSWNTPASNRVLVSKGLYGAPGDAYALAVTAAGNWQAFYAPPNPAFWYSTNSAGHNTGALKMIAMLRSGASPNAYINNTALGTDASGGTLSGAVSNAENFRVGYGPSGSPIDAEIVAVAVWRRALTTTEIAAINTYYGTA